jgi:hypothetical protein
MSNFEEYRKWKAATVPYSKSALTSKQIDDALKLGGIKGVMGLAYNPYTPSETLRYIASHYGNSEHVLDALASNPSTPLLFLKELYMQDVYKKSVAGNTSLSEEFSFTISQSDSFPVLNMLAANPSIPQTILNELFQKSMTLSEDNNILVRQRGNELLVALAANHKTPLPFLKEIYNIIELLSTNRSPFYAGVLKSLASNPSSTEEILKGVKGFVENSFFIDPQVTNLAFSKNTATPVEVLESIYDNTKDNVLNNRNTQINLATNPSTPYHVLKALSQNRDLYGAILANPNLTIELIEGMNLDLIGSEYLQYFLSSPLMSREKFQNIVRSSKILPHNTGSLVALCLHPSIAFEDILHPSISRYMNNQYENYHMFILLDTEESKYPQFKQFMQHKYNVDITGMPPQMVMDLMGNDFYAEVDEK